jgi:hypothetical protein
VQHYEKNIIKQNIAGIDGYTLVFKFGSLNQISYITKNNSAYEFFIQARDGNEKVNLELANQILSTFKFID